MKHFIIQYIILMASIQLGYSQESSVYDSYVPFPISSPKLSCSAMPRSRVFFVKLSIFPRKNYLMQNRRAQVLGLVWGRNICIVLKGRASGRIS